MDDETRALLIEADSYLSLLFYRYVRKSELPPMLEYEINDLIGRLRRETQ